MLDPQYEQAMHALYNRPIGEPLSDEEIELMWEKLLVDLGRVNRSCNILLNRGHLGLPTQCIWSLDLIKTALSHIRYALDHRHDTPA